MGQPETALEGTVCVCVCVCVRAQYNIKRHDMKFPF